MSGRRALAELLLAALLAGGASGCAGASAPRSAADPDEMAELKARVIELQRKAAVEEVEIARLRQQVAELAGGHAGTAAVPRRSARPAAEPPRDLDAADPSLRPAAPPPAIEEADLDIAPPPAGGKAAKKAPPPPPPPPARSKAAPPVRIAEESPPPRPAPAEPGEAGRPVPAAAQALYDRGYSLYNQGHFVDAEASFQRFLQAEPASDLSDNALYWIGECRYSRGDMKGALAAFRETVQRFPEGNKVPDAMLKAGQTLESMHDMEGARTTYREVVRRFPGTAAAALADERRSKLP